MQILVVSDTHGDYVTFDKLIRSKPKAEIVIFCGDGHSDFEEVKRNYPEKMFIGVKGNCDWSCPLPNLELRTIEGKKFYITHGHIENVKYGLGALKRRAMEEKADIVLYGHTHVANIEHEAYNYYEADGEKDRGMWIMNPGSLRRFECSYGLIDIQNGQVLMNTAIFS